jgi:pimeloyl-ACP methyl ester carboxylesterase
MAVLCSTKARVARLETGVISWTEAGEGTALVLLHGIGSASKSWAAQVRGLSQKRRVIAWDAPGYGGSSTLAQDEPEAGDYADALAGLLDRLNIAHCHLVGHSLGCLIAARFACTHRERLMSLTLASCALGHARLAPDERARLLAARLDDLKTLGAQGMADKRGPRLLSPSAPASVIASVVQAMASVNLRGYGQAAGMLSRGDLLLDIGSLSRDLPVQFVWGDADVITPPAANQKAASLLRDARTTIIAGAGHACYVERPDAFNAAVDEFVRLHEQGS